MLRVYLKAFDASTRDINDFFDKIVPAANQRRTELLQEAAVSIRSTVQFDSSERLLTSIRTAGYIINLSHKKPQTRQQQPTQPGASSTTATTQSSLESFELSEGLSEPAGIAISHTYSRLYCADRDFDKIRSFRLEGDFIAKFGGKADLCNPCGLAVNSEDHLIVADCNNHCICIFNFDGCLDRCFGSEGSGATQLSFPTGVAVDDQDNIFVADSGNGRICKFNSDGRYLTSFGQQYIDEENSGQLCGIAVNSDNHILVPCREQRCVRIFSRGGALLSTFTYKSNKRSLKGPRAVATTSSGGYVIVDKDRLYVVGANGDCGRILPCSEAGGITMVSPNTAAVSVPGGVRYVEIPTVY